MAGLEGLYVGINQTHIHFDNRHYSEKNHITYGKKTKNNNTYVKGTSHITERIWEIVHMLEAIFETLYHMQQSLEA